MIYFAKWKIVLVLLICTLGIVYAAPNVLDRQAMTEWAEDAPSWLPVKQVNLGLDLQGGTHLLARVEYEDVITRQVEALESNIRRALRDADISRQGGIETRGDAVILTLRSPADSDRLQDVVTELDERFLVTTDGASGLTEISFRTEAVAEVRDNAVLQSIEIIRTRIDELGTTEPNIQRQGEDRVLVQVPGEGDSGRVKDLIGTTARMAFHMLHETWLPGDALPSTPPRRAFIAESHERVPGTDEPVFEYLVSRTENVSGENLVDAQPTLDENNQIVVSFRFDAAGARAFADTTRANVQRHLAILLDDRVISAPRINEPILGGAGIITGGFSVQEANDLALLLRAGALPAELTFLEERTVGPSLGADSIEAGQTAAVIGMVLVVVFMIATYGMFGAMAVSALIFNLALILAVLSGIQATLTLPGIAGIVLTVGMAVDANVLIFERIREEIANKRSPISAIDAGYSRALTTIIDSNLTTLIAAILLFALGSGPVRGFAITLGIGILASMFTAIMVTRLMIVTWLRRTRPKSIPI